MSETGPVRLSELTTEDVGAAQRAAEVAILPVGAVEQHGPHLAVLTDARIGEAFAARLAGELDAVERTLELTELTHPRTVCCMVVGKD